MRTVLMVAEKPSIADSIARALATSAYRPRVGKTPVHEFPGEFQHQPCVYKVRPSQSCMPGASFIKPCCVSFVFGVCVRMHR